MTWGITTWTSMNAIVTESLFASARPKPYGGWKQLSVGVFTSAADFFVKGTQLSAGTRLPQKKTANMRPELISPVMG